MSHRWLSVMSHRWLSIMSHRWLSVMFHRWLSVMSHRWISVMSHHWLSVMSLSHHGALNILTNALSSLNRHCSLTRRLLLAADVVQSSGDQTGSRRVRSYARQRENLAEYTCTIWTSGQTPSQWSIGQKVDGVSKGEEIGDNR